MLTAAKSRNISGVQTARVNSCPDTCLAGGRFPDQAAGSFWKLKRAADGQAAGGARMKKVKPGSRSTAAKGKGAGKSVDEYLAGVPEQSRSALNKIRAAIRSAVPAEAVEIISYGIPAFKHKRVLVWYAAFSNHCSLFPTAAVIEEFKDELKGLSTSKGTIHFSVDKPVPAALVKKLVKARVAREESKKRG
jgi:uncharacterized protein YdhG (YjbR/CyaY superfamily)